MLVRLNTREQFYNYDEKKVNDLNTQLFLGNEVCWMAKILVPEDIFFYQRSDLNNIGF